MKKISLVIALFFGALSLHAQKQDTVIVNLGKTSKIIFTVEDPADLEVLKHYNFQLLFEDILRELEAKKSEGIIADTTAGNTEEVITRDDSDNNERNEEEREEDPNEGESE